MRIRNLNSSNSLFYCFNRSLAVFISTVLLSEFLVATPLISLAQTPQPPSSSTKPTPPEPEKQVIVSEVLVEGAQGSLQDLIYKTASTKPGKNSTRSQLQKDINAIFVTGWFSNVQAVPADTPLGVRVTFIVKTNPVLRKVEVIAVRKASSIISPQVVNNIFSKEYGSILNLGKLQEDIKQLNKWYQDKGYIAAQVFETPKVDDNGVVKLEVAEGLIEDIQVKYITADGKDKDEKGKPIEGAIPAKLIVEEFNTQPGEIFFKPTIEKKLHALLDFGVFQNLEANFNLDNKKKKGLVIVNVTENELAEKLGEKYFKFQQQLKIAKSKTDEIGIANVTNNIANIYAGLKEENEQEQAISKYQEALKTFQNKQDLIGQAKVFNNLGNTYSKLNKYQQAIDNYNQALSLFKKFQMPFWQALTLNNLALNYSQLQEKDKSLELYSQALTMWRKFAKNPSLAKVSVASSVPNSEGTSTFIAGATTSTTKGTNWISSEQIGNSEALKYMPVADIRYWEAETIFNLSAVYQALGEYQQAFYLFNDGEKVWSDINFNKLVSSNEKKGENENNFLTPLFLALPNLAKIRLYIDADHTKKAVDNLNNLISIFKKATSSLKLDSRNTDSIIQLFQPFFTYLFTSFTSKYEGNKTDELFTEKVGEGLNQFVQTLDKDSSQPTYQAISKLILVITSINSTNKQQIVDNLNQAEPELEKFIKKYPQFNSYSGLFISWLMETKAKALSELGRNTETIEIYKKALLTPQLILGYNIQNKPELLYLIGKSYLANGEYQQAEDYFNQSLIRAKLKKNILQEADVYLGLAMLGRQRGNFQKALKQIETAIDKIESENAQTANATQQEQDAPQLRKTEYRSYLKLAKYLESKQNYYDFYIDLLMELHQKNPNAGYDIQGLQASERSHARSLLAMINRASQNPPFRKQSQKNSDSRYIELAQAVQIQQIQKQILDDNTLLLEYSLGEERSYLWVVSKTGVSSYQLPKRSEIEPLARKFYESVISRSSYFSDRQSSQQLSQILIGQVASQLGQKRLLIIADGILQYTPFSALPNPNSRSDAPEPLLVNHEIVGLPSASTLVITRRNQNIKPTKTLALFADPVFSRNDKRLNSRLTNSNDEELYQQLDGTRQEANEILPLFPDSQKSAKFDFAANRQAAISPEISQYRFVHFASHGILDSQQPERSGMILSIVNEAGEVQRSLLSTSDVFNLKLSADLVVLSGCRTGLGTVVKGEGLVGLTGGLMYAGSKSVVSSLWDVSDHGTALLMSKFYSAILKKGLKPSAALRQAQLEMWQDPQSQWKAPYYWSAFVLQGEWQ